jgi:hypothetical protein
MGGLQMIFDYREREPQPYFSVVTIYSHPRQVDGKYIGRYGEHMKQ